MDLSKFPKLKHVVYNDFNPLNANLFNCIRQYKEFYEYIKDIPSQEKDRFNEYQKHAFSVDPYKLLTGEPNFQLGLEYIYTVTQVFSGSKPETSKFIDLKGKYKSKFDTFKGKLINPKFFEHYDRISYVSSVDFETNIKKWDSEKSYFYADPPYYLTEKYYSKHDFGLNDHERLANVLKNVKSKFALSYYDFPQLSEWFPKDEYTWESKEFKKAAAAKAGVKQNNSEELLIMNY